MAVRKCCVCPVQCFVGAEPCVECPPPPGSIVPYFRCIDVATLEGPIVFRDQFPEQGECWTIDPAAPQVETIPAGGQIHPFRPDMQFPSCPDCCAPGECFKMATPCDGSIGGVDPNCAFLQDQIGCVPIPPGTPTPYLRCEEVTECIVFRDPTDPESELCWIVGPQNPEVQAVPPNGIQVTLADLTTFADCQRCCGCDGCFDLQNCPPGLQATFTGFVLDPNYPHQNQFIQCELPATITRIVPKIGCCPGISPAQCYQVLTGEVGGDGEPRVLISFGCLANGCWIAKINIQMEAFNPFQGVFEPCTQGEVEAQFNGPCGCVLPCPATYAFIPNTDQNLDPNAPPPTLTVSCEF